jgi:hypothetical protein
VLPSPAGVDAVREKADPGGRNRSVIPWVVIIAIVLAAAIAAGLIAFSGPDVASP